MRVDARVDPNSCRYRVFDHKLGGIRKDLFWADSDTHQVGADIGTGERVEQRKSVIIIPSMFWIAIDTPEDSIDVKTAIEEAIKIAEGAPA